MLIERISGIMTIYKVNTPNFEYVNITVRNECPKIYSDHALSVKVIFGDLETNVMIYLG
jgi:hypothetical protein